MRLLLNNQEGRIIKMNLSFDEVMDYNEDQMQVMDYSTHGAQDNTLNLVLQGRPDSGTNVGYD